MLHSSLICGKGTHKGKGEDINWIIKVYYNFPGALFALCFCSEVNATQGFVVCSYLSYATAVSLASAPTSGVPLSHMAVQHMGLL